ncbi:Hsp20/alpha crystallin family protein (plasmid) [Streptococcus thermophilus]|jgi:HSP20 family protein|uniref:Small heat shock protein n=1 Tax=Streptococcus thermophilus TaxID=1308 RepID=Q9X9C3_STRTR|nr:Hsp20/alpha crystallin family protein [Streptococcus thermophilus]ABJ67110.1 heat shock protein Hsp20 [Streptococcus thermophilus LMD-9]ADN51982.1 small heat shock protein [Streptococcus thermophilus]ADN51984.1 small heat shock protein [Streptococcus thermophilus]MBW7805479.1 Hsp20/alpha crystallin family protein [Streptococcus thermophilus]POO08983.1 Acid shock protein [Streptococcus thermophilus]
MLNKIQPRNSDTYSMTPFDFFEDFSRNLFNDFKSNLIKTDIHETDNEYLVEAELPGIPKENIQVTYEDGVLTISGQQQIDTVDEDKKGKLIRSERSSTSLRRQYLLENVKEDEIKASYSDGILKVTLPKDSNKEIKKSIPIE